MHFIVLWALIPCAIYFDNAGAATLSAQDHDTVCGIKRPTVAPNIIGGKINKQLDYPWHVGVYDSDRKQYLCGGSILNEQVILSAAHCFTNLETGSQLPKENYLIAAGKYYRQYNDSRDENAQYSTIADVHLPTRYKGDITQYEADLAVVILTNKLIFSSSVGPVCVDWYNVFEYQQISGSTLRKIVGWGDTVEGNQLSEEINELSVPIIPYDQCYAQVPKAFRKYLTHDKVCSGSSGNTTAACPGYGGGGLTFANDNDRFYIRGILSTASAGTQGTCDSNQYTTYTLLSKYIDFVKHYVL